MTVWAVTLERRLIGQTDLAVTMLGFGGAPLGSVGEQITSDEATAIVASAWAAGLRYFDTAPLYGRGLSEKRIGAALSTYDRNDFVLSSKIGRLLVPGDGGKAPSVRYDYSYDAVRQSVEASLERLGLDRIDILLCHDIDVWTHGDQQPGVYRSAIEGALPAMNALRAEGVVGAIGLGVNEWQVCNQVLDEIDVDCFLLAGRFTLLEQEPLDEFLPKCVERQVSVIVGGPYNSGLLTDVEYEQATYDYRPVPNSLWMRVEAMRDVCGHHGVDIRAAALQYPLRHPAVAAVIPGVKSLGEVAGNVAFVAQDLPDDLWADLASTGLSRSW